MSSRSSALGKDIQPFPLLGGLREGPPFHIALTSENHDLYGMDLSDQEEFQRYLERTYGDRYAWGLSGYLEFREPLLRHLPHMCRQRRYYHLGVDVIAPVGSPLFTPLPGRVVEVGYEVGRGNYGGFVLLRHEGDAEPFYSFYGHLDTDTLPSQHSRWKQGQEFACIGNFACNGQWFHHAHLQMLTERGLREGYLHRGYCSEQDLDHMPELCPSPMAIFRQ